MGEIMDETNKKSQHDEVVAGWSYALADGRRQMAAARRRVRELSLAVRVCEERVRNGEKWPGTGEPPFIGQTES